MLHRLRKALSDNQGGFGKLTKLGGPDGDEVEVDETFVGGKTINMHKKRRLGIQKKHMAMVCPATVHRYVNKTPVQGILDRELRQVRAKAMPDVKRETLQ